MNDQIECAGCGTEVALAKNYAGKLEVTCGCDQRRAVKVSRKIPEEWTRSTASAAVKPSPKHQVVSND